MVKHEGDYYFTDDGLMVFTKEYHLKRGFCCKNNCRHCPWNKSDSPGWLTNKIKKKTL